MCCCFLEFFLFVFLGVFLFCFFLVLLERALNSGNLLIPNTNFVMDLTRGHPRGQFGRKSLPQLADFSLFELREK